MRMKLVETPTHVIHFQIILDDVVNQDESCKVMIEGSYQTSARTNMELNSVNCVILTAVLALTLLSYLVDTSWPAKRLADAGYDYPAT